MRTGSTNRRTIVPETEAVALEADIAYQRTLLPGLKIQGFHAEEIL